jgi:hypothetical protein
MATYLEKTGMPLVDLILESSSEISRLVLAAKWKLKEKDLSQMLLRLGLVDDFDDDFMLRVHVPLLFSDRFEDEAQSEVALATPHLANLLLPEIESYFGLTDQQLEEKLRCRQVSEDRISCWLSKDALSRKCGYATFSEAVLTVGDEDGLRHRAPNCAKGLAFIGCKLFKKAVLQKAVFKEHIPIWIEQLRILNGEDISEGLLDFSPDSFKATCTHGTMSVLKWSLHGLDRPLVLAQPSPSPPSGASFSALVSNCDHAFSRTEQEKHGSVCAFAGGANASVVALPKHHETKEHFLKWLQKIFAADFILVFKDFFEVSNLLSTCEAASVVVLKNASKLVSVSALIDAYNTTLNKREKVPFQAYRLGEWLDPTKQRCDHLRYALYRWGGGPSSSTE